MGLEDTDRAGTVEYLPFQLYLEKSSHFGNLDCHIVIAVLGSVGQAITGVVQDCPIVCFGRLYDG